VKKTKLAFLSLAIAGAMILTGCNKGDASDAVNSPTKNTQEKTLVKQVEQSSPYKEGVHYTILDKPLMFPKNHVLEYFWYGCPHCHEAEPIITKWAASSGVKLEHRHSVLSENWNKDAEVFYTFKKLGVLDKLHTAYFNIRHESFEFSQENLDKLLTSNQIDPVVFAKEGKSPEVQTAMAVNKLVEGTLKTSGVPTFVVSGKYLILLDHISKWEDVTNIAKYLIEKQPAHS